MKKIIFRKLLLDCFVFFLLALFGISAIIWVFQAVNFLDIMIEDGRNYIVYLNYTLLSFPKIIGRILPFDLFFSFAYIFIRYENNNEFIIFWNHGVKKISIINFFFSFSLFIMLFQILLLSLAIPKSQEMARTQLRSTDVDYFEGLIKPKKFNDTIKGLTIFAEEKNSNNEFINIYIKKKTSNDQFQITFAKKGIFELKGNNRILVLYDGQTLNSNKNQVTNFSFSKSDFGLSDMSSHFLKHQKLQEQTTRILFKCVMASNAEERKKIKNCDPSSLRNVYKELFKRLAGPLYLPVLILVSLFLILNSKENINYNKNKIFVYLLGIIIIIISESSLGYINNNNTRNILLVTLPLLLATIFYFIFQFKLRLKQYSNKI